MSRVVEKFAYLKDVGEGLLHRLYNARFYFSSDKTRPSWLKDPQVQKSIKSLLVKFPDFPDTDKLQGYEHLITRAKAINDDLEPHYETLVDCSDWKDAALSLLTEIANTSVSLKLDENPVLTTHWLDLMVLYVRLHALASTIADRKLALGLYYKMFYHIRSTAELHYQKASKWATEFDSPFRKIQEEFRVINDAMGKVLLSLPYTKTRSINSLRKEGALNITLKPEDLTKPSMDQGRLELALASKMYMWIIYGFVCTPGVCGTKEAVDLAKFALAEGYQSPVFKDVSWPIYVEYASLFSTYKTKTINLTKQKKLIKEAAVASVAEAGRRHFERRVYVRQELEALYLLFKDRPALLGPKIQILWAALSLAKEEIFWYFRHVETPPPEKLKKAFKAEDFKDKRISSLIHLIDVIIAFVNMHRHIVITYYLEYMCGADLSSLSQLLDANFLSLAGPNQAQYANSILQDLQSINTDQWNSGSSPIPSFVALRDNWLRLEVAMSTPGATAPIIKFKNLAHRMSMIYAHSRNVDCLDEMIEDYSDLRTLWYYKDTIFGTPVPPSPTPNQPQQGTSVFDIVISDGPDQPLHAMSFMRLLAIFPQNATQYWPEERELIGNEVVSIANTCLTKIATRVVTILNTVTSNYIQSEYQLADYNAAIPLLQKRKEWKPPKDWTPPIEPGSESLYKNRQNLENQRLYQRNAAQLCTALNEMLEIVVYDQVFAPREFLREKMSQAIRQFMRKAVVASVAGAEIQIQRPSILELQIKTCVGVFATVENFLDLDVLDLLREALLGESYARVMGKLGKVDWFPEGDVDFEGGMTGVLAIWYTEFIAKKINTGVCFSPLRQGFVRTGTPVTIKAEEYADIVELKALARLVGPYGVKLIERELLRFVLTNVAPVREAVVANVSVLEEILANFHKEAKCTEALKKLRDVDTFVNKSIAIGNALAFRRLLKTALHEVAQAEVPYIVSAVDAMYNQYPANVFMFPDLLQSDTLAMDLGIATSTSDQALKVVLKKATTDTERKLWELLPVLYAASFATSVAWREASFRPNLEGYANNNHSLIYTINDLTTAFASNTFASSGNVEDITALMLRFVEVSSVILLRMARAPKDKHSPVDFASVIIFMDRFVQECPLLTEDMLERTLPYTLLRNMYKQLYEDKQGAKHAAGEGGPDGTF